MMAAQDIDIDRSPLVGCAGQVAHLLNPIVSRIREQGLKATKIHTDDTPVPMLVLGKGRTAVARLWAYFVDDGAWGSATLRHTFVSLAGGLRRPPSLKMAPLIHAL